MQKLQFFVVAASLFLPAIATAKSYLPSGCGTYVICKETKDKEGRLDGPQVCVNAKNDKIKVIEANWKADLLVGEFKCGNDDGEPKVKAQYKNGELDGLYQEWDSGLKDWSLSQIYKNGKQHGLKTRKLSGGRKIVVNYIDDKPHGYELVVDSNNKILSKNSCRVGNERRPNEECDKIALPGFDKAIEEHGSKIAAAKKQDDNQLVEKKNRSGIVVSRHKLVDGKIEGKWETFFNDGKPESISTYKNGKKLDEKVFFNDGQLKSEILFEGDWPKKETQYYQNGKTKSQSVASRASDTDTRYDYKYYYDNGQLSEVGSRLSSAYDTWSTGVRDGDYKAYDEKGQVIGEGTYKLGKPQGLWKVVYKKYKIEDVYKDGEVVAQTVFDKVSGKQLRKREFMPDGSTKSDVKSPDYKEE